MKIVRHSWFVANLVLIALVTAGTVRLWADRVDYVNRVSASIPLRGQPKYLQLGASAGNGYANVWTIRTDYAMPGIEAYRGIFDRSTWSPTHPDRPPIRISVAGEFRLEMQVEYLFGIPVLWLGLCILRLFFGRRGQDSPDFPSEEA